jgi:hypothetical protein
LRASMWFLSGCQNIALSTLHALVLALRAALREVSWIKTLHSPTLSSDTRGPKGFHPGSGEMISPPAVASHTWAPGAFAADIAKLRDLLKGRSTGASRVYRRVRVGRAQIVAYIKP